MSQPNSPNLKLTPARILVGIIVIVLLFWNQQAPKEESKSKGPADRAVLQSDSGTDGADASNAAAVLDSVNSSGTDDFLEEVEPDVFESPAGLVYRSGSADGHRLQHVMRHTQDNPEKPVHGVFTGSRNEVLLLLDEVWKSSQERGPPAVSKKFERGRTVITADVGRKIGYVGGQSGARAGKPDCSRVRLVLEDHDVITAYPLK